jgi:hypothetical protein
VNELCLEASVSIVLSARRVFRLYRFDLRRLTLIAGLLFAGLMLTPRTAAQTTASLSGTVRDTDGGVIPGAKIDLIETKNGAKRSTISNSAGDFNLTAVQPSTYNVVVTAKNFETYKVTGIELHPGDSQKISNLTLKIGAVEVQVEVTAATAGVTLDSPEKSVLITSDDIQRLSTVGRDVSELIKILPGFAVATAGSLNNQNPNVNAQTMGFGTSSVSSFSANGSTPQTGATAVTSDGANVTDPGDMGASIANVNMDMVQEVKVQTSNFGADSAKGPVVINAIGKSGGSDFHGSVYLFARNGVLNSNDWQNNYFDIQRPPSEYYYPGVNVGGPVKIPGTNFNHAKKITFFAAYEYYKQTIFNQTVASFIPSARMLGGDLTPASIGAALNVDPSVVTAQCPNFYSSGTLTNSGGYCYSPGLGSTSTFTQQGQQIVAGSIVGLGTCNLQTNPQACLPVDPRAQIFAKFWPATNRTPQAGNGLASDGYNYAKAITSTHNGYQYRGRVDDNFSDQTKLYATYNFEKINDQSPITNTFYAGSDIIPYPTSAFSNAKSDSLSINFTKVLNSTMTNEAIATGTYYYQPEQLANRSLVQDANTGWHGGRFYNNNALQLPDIIDYEEGVPDFGMSYFPAGSAFLRKYSANLSDNFTKQIRTHTVKIGVYAEKTANNQILYSSSQGQWAFNHYNQGCALDTGTSANTGVYSALQNNVANFDQGCGGLTQTNSSPSADMNFKTLDFYGTDEWKVNRKLTLTLGLRFDHLGPWVDAHGNGLAVWNAPPRYQALSSTQITSDPRSYPGISWHQTNPDVPLSGAPSTFLFYSPRAGLAYDLYGDGKTVLRGGWGAYRFHDSYNDSAGALNTTIGVQTYQTQSNLSCTYDQVANVAPTYYGNLPGTNTAPGVVGCNVNATGSNAPFTIYALDPHDSEQPVTYNYNFTVDQQVFFKSLLEISYVGNQSKHTFTSGNLSNQNYIPLGGLFQPDPQTGAVTQPGSSQQVLSDYRPYPTYLYVFVPSHIGYANYNALQVSWNKQKGAIIYGFNYTWSKALGIRGDYRTGAVGDPSILRNNYGILGFNRDNAVNFTYSIEVGDRYHGNRFVAHLVNQWEISGISSIQSGPDASIANGTSNTNFNLSGGVSYTVPGATTATLVTINNSTILGTPDINLQPIVTCNPKSNLHNTIAGHQYINGSCFALPKLGTNGPFNLPDIHGPAYMSNDLTVQRSFKLKAKQELQFRLAGFNFLNHPLPTFNIAGNQPGLGLGFSSPTAGTATSAAQAFAQAVESTQTQLTFGYTPYKIGFRIVELSVRYNF